MALPKRQNNNIILPLSIFCLLTFKTSTDSAVNSLPHAHSLHMTPINMDKFWCLTLYLQGNTQNTEQNWVNHGGDLYNRRYANKEKKISPATVSKLNLKWKFYAGCDISVTPAIFNNTLYFPSWNGYLYAVKAADGSLIWKQNLQNLTRISNPGFTLNVNSTVSRSTPTVAGNLLIFGLWGPAVVVAVKRSNGKLVWKTMLDDHARSFITMSGTYYKELVFAIFAYS